MIVRKKEGEPYKITRTIVIDKELFDDLKALAEERKVSWSSLACEFILSGLIRNRKNKEN